MLWWLLLLRQMTQPPLYSSLVIPKMLIVIGWYVEMSIDWLIYINSGYLSFDFTADSTPIGCRFDRADIVACSWKEICVVFGLRWNSFSYRCESRSRFYVQRGMIIYIYYVPITHCLIFVRLIRYILLILQMRSAVKHAAEYFPTAIITGRSYDKVRFIIYELL